MRRHPLLEELVHATVAMTVLVAVIVMLYWVIMGEPPWALAAGGAVGFVFGIIILTITSPIRR